MSSYLKQGQRRQKVAKDKLTKKHVKSFYQILERMDIIAKELDPELEYTEENIDEYVEPKLGRKLDGMEKMIVLGKLHYRKEENNANEN